MKKIWLFLFFMTLSFLFLQCTPENEEEIVECEKIEIYNTIGVRIAEYENTDRIDGIETSGIYLLKITNKGIIGYDRIVVK